MFYLDPLYFAFAIPGLIFALIAQVLVWIAYRTYSSESAGTDITGVDAAKIIAQKEQWNIGLQTSPGKLNDFFNPMNNTVNLSEDNLRSGSVANIAVVAHEFGHVEQKFSASAIFKVRTAMVPLVNIGSSLGYILFFVGLVLSILSLAQVGLVLFALTTVFAFITLPLEFDASRRGLRLIEKHNLIDSGKRGGARIVLTAAALTYIAGFVSSLLNLLYFVALLNRNRD
jgi:Zn-dependent membrane protease YugP